MFNHEPENYDCPFCNLKNGIETDLNSKADIVFENATVMASVAPQWWVNNHGHVLVVPKEHYENIYDIPEELLAELYKVVKKISIAIRNTYGCDGTSNRQHNEPAGNQYVWHFHTHVFPRYENDNLYVRHHEKKKASPEERLPYAEKIRAYLSKHS